MHFTPGQLEATYEMLRTTPPFKRWKLPHADEVEFFVISARDRAGHYRGLDCHKKGRHKNPEIAVSAKRAHCFLHLYEVMAHEMIHFHLDRCGLDDSANHHGPDFKRMGAQVRRYHGFDSEAF